jgi:hypothetical protein
MISILILRWKYIINHWGLMKKNYFGWSGLYFIFILHLYMTVTCRHTIVFNGKDCFNYARDIWTVVEEIKHQSCTRKIFYQIIKININVTCTRLFAIETKVATICKLKLWKLHCTLQLQKKVSTILEILQAYIDNIWKNYHCYWASTEYTCTYI